MRTKKFYGKGLPQVDPALLKGTLIVIEGSDGAGRSTQIGYLQDWLERKGYPTALVGLKRSELVGEALNEAMMGNTLTPITLNLFYATDFADQLERVILPALKAGFVVLCDRYIYTLMARDIVRGSSMDWLKEIYGFALEPDAVFYLNVSPKVLAERNFRKKGFLDYWESGMDIQRWGGMYDNFIKYQARLHRVFETLRKEYGFTSILGNRSAVSIAKEIRAKVEKILAAASAAEKAVERTPAKTEERPAQSKGEEKGSPNEKDSTPSEEAGQRG